MPDPPSPDLASFMEVDQQTLQQEAVEYQDALRRLNEDDTNFIAEVLAERGEKADDAEDFGDISDDDLPEEEDVIEMNGGDPPGLTDDTGTTNDIDIDDLFEGPGSPIPDEHGEHDAQDPASQDLHINGHQNGDSNEETLEQLRERNFPTLYEATNQDPSIPAPAENQAEFVKVLFPAFKEGAILNWNDLLPPKNAYFNLKVPQKEPKPVHPTKVSLEIAPDQEKSFRTAGPATSDKRKRVQEAEAKGLIAIVEESSDEGESKEDFDWEPPSRTELIGNKFTWTDLEILCDDWDARLNAPVKEIHTLEGDDENMDEWEREILGPSAKRRKVTHDDELDFMSKPRYKVPSFDDFERTVKLAGKTAILDPNDPHLLLDYIDCNAAPKRSNLGGNFKRSGNGSMAKKFSQRFNISNDEAYDALKENHQSKVRAALNNLTVEHSLPAIKLVHPYYKFKLDIAGARSFHRPGFKTKAVGANITFSRPGTRKRKDVKGMPTQEVFAESKDLTLGDHYATATLLEYSEEHPTVLSNFGMGNRIINYYRKKNADDNYRPPAKDYIGDSAILLPEDKSPFSNFGSVDPGETVPTLHNSMYRAPIFKHETKPTDFLVIRATTGIGGSNWHIRNIDNLFAVGQQFPMLEVPGPHARKVTNAAKCRMKMISFRKMRHHPKQEMKISEITAHIADSNDMQNRQKMKEFASYDKNDKVWKMKPGEQIPDETVIRAMVSPEDVCLIDAMQVGQQHLRDAGYAQDEIDDEDDTDNLEQNLAPWKTTKAFIDAAADKAMLRLHGEGDPSGCGLAFSFIKTSMKGGYMGAIQGPSATSADAIARERKANGGHTYNVRKQQAAYNDAIRDIWEKQKANLSDPTEHVENDLEREQADEDERLGVQTNGNTVAGHTGFDDSASQISRFSNNSHSQGRIMRIIRRVRNKVGNIEEIPEIVKDARVMREYQKRRAAIVASSMNVYEAKPTGDAEFDKKQAEEARKELIRLERNKERRHAREKQKGIYRASVDRETTTAASPASTPVPSIEKPTGTTRKCANCGQAGHIKTNKKYYCSRCAKQA